MQLVAALGLLAWAAIVRLPFAGNTGEDEIFFALVAQRWLGGLLPYVASFDVKPAGLFAVFAVAQALFGTSVATIKGLEIACCAATAFGLHLIGARHLSRPAGWIAAVLYPVYSLALSGVNAPTELLKAPFEVFAVLAALEAVRGGRVRLGWIGVAGLLLGGAATVKQTAAFTAVALVLAIVPRIRERRAWAAVAFGVGIVALPAGFAALYLSSGELPALLSGAVFGAAGRLSGDNVGFIEGVLRFPPGMKPLIVLLIAAMLVLTRGGRLRAGPQGPGCRFTLAWLAGEAAGIIATRSMYDHYFLALVPPLALLTGITLWHLFDVPHGRRVFVAASVLALALAWPPLFEWRGLAHRSDFAAAAAVGDRLTEAGVAPDGRILVVDRGLLVHLLSGRAVASRYFHPQHLLCSFPAPDADPLAVALSGRPGAIVVADTRHGMVCERDDRWAELLTAIGAGYCLAGHVPGEADDFDIYVARKDGQANCPGTSPVVSARVGSL